MRVLHLTSSFPRTADDHVAPFLLDLLRAQRQAGVDVAVLAPHDQDVPRQQDLDGIEVHRFRYGPDRWEHLAYRGGLLGRVRRPSGALLLPVFLAAFTVSAVRVARRFRPDVVHAHWWLPAGLCGLAASRLAGAPLVITLHGTDVHLLRNRVVRAVAGYVLRRAALVAVISADLQRTVISLLGLDPARVAVLRMPVARVDDLHPMPSGDPVRIIAAGRLSPEKGFDLLLAAVRIAVDEGLDVRLELVGSGPERERLAELAEPLQERVHLRPALPRVDLWALIDQAHAMIVPSRREGLGLVALEALARGRPVIATSAGGLPEVVQDGTDGVLVPPGDPAALAAALHKLPLGPPVGRALDLHSPADVAAAHSSAYTRVLGQG